MNEFKKIWPIVAGAAWLRSVYIICLLLLYKGTITVGECLALIIAGALIEQMYERGENIKNTEGKQIDLVGETAGEPNGKLAKKAASGK